MYETVLVLCSISNILKTLHYLIETSIIMVKQAVEILKLVYFLNIFQYLCLAALSLFSLIFLLLFK